MQIEHVTCDWQDFKGEYPVFEGSVEYHRNHTSPSNMSIPGNECDAWRCVCGNTPSDAGFFPVNINTPVNEYPDDTNDNLYRCDNCYRIIELSQGYVVGRSTKPETSL